MREDEIFVLKSIARQYSATWRPGENPPDGYITYGARDVAVEVSTLTQYITDNQGTRPRNSDDISALRLADELDLALGSSMPDDRRVILILNSPIVAFRKTKIDLEEKILAFVSKNADSHRSEEKLSVRGNDLEIILTTSEVRNGKSVIGFVKNRASSSDIMSNAIYMLETRIEDKARKCSSLAEPVWLALRNDYWLADVGTYRDALNHISISHRFEKILLVSNNGSVDVLVGSAA